MKDITFTYDEETKTTYCHCRNSRNVHFMGQAQCHESDYDMENTLTGQEIAFRRAKIAFLCDERDNNLKPRLAALEQLLYSMKHSCNFNPNSYESKMLRRQIYLTTFDLTTVKEMIQYERQNLKTFIEKKDKMYQTIRKHRQGKID